MTAALVVRPRFTVTRYSEISDEHHKRWIVDDLLGAGEFSGFYGTPGCGKSVVIGDMGAHIAAGIPWFGRPVIRGVVVYIAAERGALVKRRLAAWRKRHEVRDIPLLVIEGVFRFGADLADALEIVRLANAEAARWGLQVVLIIIDTKAQVMAGADPNSDSDTMALVGNVALFQQETGAHVALVDHVPHSAPDRMKGSGALAGAVDGSFLVTKVARGHHRVTIGSKPPNDGPDELDIAFGLESVALGTDDAGKVTKAPVVVECDHAAPVTARRRPKLSHGGQKLMAAFNRTFEAGKTSPAPQVPGVPSGTRAVAMVDLQEAAFKIGLCPDIEPPEAGKDRDRWRNKRNQAWKRAVQEVERLNCLRTELGFAWDPNRTGAMTDSDAFGDG